MKRERELHRSVTLATPRSTPSSISTVTQNSTTQYFADLDPEYFRSLISHLHRTGAPLLPSPTHQSHFWSSSHHSNFTFFSFQFTSHSYLLPFIHTQFSLLTYFYLLLVFFWTNLVFLFNHYFKSTPANQTVIADAVLLHQLEVALFLEPTIGADIVSQRLWRDDTHVAVN